MWTRFNMIVSACFAGLAATFFIAVMHGCSSDPTSSSSSSNAMTTAITAAVTAADSSLPSVDYTLAYQSPLKKWGNWLYPLAWAALDSTTWSSSSSTYLIRPPGGSGSGCTEPSYQGVSMPSTVNVRDYFAMSFDQNFQRCSSDGGNYQPTLFGRMANATQIIGYLNQVIPKDSSGEFSINSGNFYTLTVNSQTIKVYALVANTTDTTYYDKRIGVYGWQDTNDNNSIDGAESQMFANLMWYRNTSAALNFMYIETGDRYNNGSGAGTSDGTPDSFTASIISYNKSTGAINFEYSSDQKDFASNGNTEIFRLRASGDNQPAHLFGYWGTNLPSSTNEFTSAVVYAPLGNSSTTASISFRHRKSTGNTSDLTGNLCVTISSSAAADGLCGAHTDAININSGAATEIPGVSMMDTILGYTEALSAGSLANAKGFTTATVNWGDSTNRNAWFTAGEVISTSFGTASQMLSQVDGTP